MDIGNKIKTYRKIQNLSQEELARKVYVSRQTVSNWETNKRYPDIQNILLLSVLFDVSVDELIRGDLEAMKDKLSNKQVNRAMSVYTLIMLIAAMIGAISIGPVFYFEESTTVVFLPIICFAIMLLSSFKLERLKNRQDLKTFSEIVAYVAESEVETQRTKRVLGKDKIQKAIMMIAFAAAFILISLISIFLFGRFN
ncbi:HTH-type transcriptional regulator ImmR [Lentilactobacillus parabuchneri]|jgi:transcriptional regulator with XRE-family HTH domain|uniref:HTH-type transcriptional regulator ImmR n=4 Tax=Lentilactobacillus parabuchneri TaxID=152331 RepID=A0A1X1FDQ2_9LACO|nr:helix-turn-helix transcriptional regulator [Lentilactobacillus parabuchneri]APR07960.1 HTH-type transcriptional regulator ImmR [Lentilactobacillus parabuchneri]KRM47201.1 helix-turn-helix domain-containing protein [Lentilactobacillus parabuchneri DSM 5707 = NBRC 107865]KRN70963.1 helix-turn-helix domain-containing protein [Lentilactobacillus parabuchneri]MBW0222069.1 helix-turn-helix domain-containing protein [Lentilactobacillus parabuchneri]MBW0245694.1 helix-turn-helix domain-containing p